jgi:hypothetical protein
MTVIISEEGLGNDLKWLSESLTFCSFHLFSVSTAPFFYACCRALLFERLLFYFPCGFISDSRLIGLKLKYRDLVREELVYFLQSTGDLSDSRIFNIMRESTYRPFISGIQKKKNTTQRKLEAAHMYPYFAPCHLSASRTSTIYSPLTQPKFVGLMK